MRRSSRPRRTDPRAAAARQAASEGLCILSCAFDLARIAERLEASGYTVHAVELRELTRKAHIVAGEIEALAGPRRPRPRRRP